MNRSLNSRPSVITRGNFFPGMTCKNTLSTRPPLTPANRLHDQTLPKRMPWKLWGSDGHREIQQSFYLDWWVSFASEVLKLHQEIRLDGTSLFGGLSSILGPVVPKTCKTVLAPCPASCLALMDECKEMVLPLTCHQRSIRYENNPLSRAQASGRERHRPIVPLERNSQVGILKENLIQQAC